MAEDVAVVQNGPSANPCCTEWKRQYLKLHEKYSKLELRRNALREGISMVNEKFDSIEKENKILKQALEGLKLQASKEKDEKEKESTMRVSLENEVSALKAELLVLQQNGNSAAEEADGAVLQLQGRLAAAETEINRLRELLDKEIVRADLEKKNSEKEKKKADEALKKINAEKNKVIKANKVADIERKKAQESRLQWEKLKTETDEAKSKLASEMSKTEEAKKKVESERQNTIQERKRADLATVKAEELRKLAEMNLKKAMDEKGRVDQLSQKLVEERKKVEKLEKDVCKRMPPFDLSERQITARNVEGKGEHCLKTMNIRGLTYEELEKKLLEREHTIIREKKRADSEKKKAEKQRKISVAHKKEAIDEKHRANLLSRELEDNKQRIEHLQKELQELFACRQFANSPLSKYHKVSSETATTELLKKQLKFEKMLVKHAKKVARAEIGRSNMLRQELIQLKQESLHFQQRLDMLNDCFLHSDEGIHEMEKIGNLSFTRKHLGRNPYQMQFDGKNELVTKPSSTASTAVVGSEPLKQNIECTTSLRPLYVSGIDSKLEPLCRVPNRKMLQTSAINSSSASFSDRPFVGSQDRGDISITTSAKLSGYTSNDSNLEPTISRLFGETRERYNPNFAAIAEDSVRSPIKGNDAERGAGHSKKRKRIVEAVESIENLYSKGQKLNQEVSEKLSVLHGILNGQKDEPAEENLQGNSHGKHVRRHKKRKSSCEEAIAIHPVHDTSEAKSVIYNLDIEEFDVCMHDSPPVYNLAKADRDRKDGLGNFLTNNRYIPRDFEELANHDHMKLLDLDNDVDEKSYRAAIATPLSPTLPGIEFQENEALEVVNSKMVVEESLYKGLSNVKDNLTRSGSVDVLDVEMDSNKSKHDGFCISQLQKNEYHVDLSKNPAGVELDVADYNNDSNSICRIIRTISCYMSQYSLLFSAYTFLPSILLSLLKAEGLSSKEKVCVFFSLILHGISECEMKNIMNLVNNDSVTSLDAFSGHLLAVLSDLDLRRIFMESCNLFELLDLVEDFLLQRKVLVCGELSSESMLECIPEMNPVLKLSVEAASSHLLVAGAILLASLCQAVDHIGFVCETSCNILMMEKFDPSVLLTILHVFAHLCGSKYFNLDRYSVAMTVVKSLVVLLEKQNCSTGSTLSPSLVGTPSEIWPCSKCPFSEGAVSMDDVALLLLEKLQKHAGACVLPEESFKFANLIAPELWSHKEKAEEVSIHGDAVLLSSVSDEILRNSIDILSLFELIAFYMGWDWAFDNIVCQLWEFLEAHVLGLFSTAIITLLGQLGRLGVNTGGYEDNGVEKLRGWLSSFLCSASDKWSIPVQFAIVNALFGVIPIKFEELIENKCETEAIISRFDAANCVRKWFFLLSSEQQSSFRLQQAASMTNCKD
ncbi:maternal effect [Abeliophyllum distichum]|uniref:Maternal effect n=1 Tax=Abeliophyllum distichum TaxID=126358 RepID=A0ABD1UI36_9LAMI